MTRGVSLVRRRAPRPVIEGRVVYLGAEPEKIVTLRGRVMLGADGRRRLVDSGSTLYSFGGPGVLRVARTCDIPQVRRRPVAIVRHPEHLDRFTRLGTGRGRQRRRLFWVFVATKDRGRLFAWRACRNPEP